MAGPEIAPFTFQLGDAAVADLRDRLSRTRWPDVLPDSGWARGAALDAVRPLVERWAEGYDFEAFVARCNQFPQVTTVIDGQQVHAIHARSPEPDAVPLIMTHGWPGSVAELFDVIGPLSDPRAHGLDPALAFHVVAPSLPGYGFSGPTSEAGWDIHRVATAFGELMSRLGYDRYFAQGGDWGSMVTSSLSTQFPEQVAAIHLTLLVAGPPKDGSEPTEAETAEMTARGAYMAMETGYQGIQATKPQTLGVALNDSPAGLATWILEKFHGWTGGDGLGEFDPDRLLDNLSIYWFTQTIHSSTRLYYETTGPAGMGRLKPASATVPMGFAHYPGEPFNSPRRWLEARFNIVHWADMAHGGHFAAMQVPGPFVDDLRTFFGSQSL